MRLLSIISAIILLLSLTSCEKELDMKYHDIEPLTVIEGVLTQEGIRVSITMTTPMDEPMDRTRYTDASVILSDLTADTKHTLTVDSEGYYSGDVHGEVGHSYRLTVEREGKVYYAETKMYAPVEIVGLGFSWIKMPYDQVAVLQCQFTDFSAGEDYFWVKVYRNGEIYQWSEKSDAGAEEGIVTFLTMTSRKDTDAEDDDTVLFDGDEIAVSVSGISRAMHDYLEALQNDSSGPAMFSGDKCLGYFMATSPVEESVIFHPGEIPVI